MKNKPNLHKIKQQDIIQSRLMTKKIASILSQFQYNIEDSMKLYQYYTINRCLGSLRQQMQTSNAFTYDCYVQDFICQACRLTARSSYLMNSGSSQYAMNYYDEDQDQQPEQVSRSSIIQLSKQPEVIKYDFQFKIKQLFGQRLTMPRSYRLTSNFNNATIKQAKQLLSKSFSCMCKVQSIIVTGCEQGFVQFPQFQAQLQLQLFEKDDNKKRRKIQAIRNKASISYAQFKSRKQVTLDI